MAGEEEMEIPENIPFSEREIFHDRAWPKLAFVEHRLSNDPTNWWIANHQGMVSMLRSCGFEIIGRPGHATYLGRLDRHRKEANRWNHSEYLSATGMDWQTEIDRKTRDKNLVLE